MLTPRNTAVSSVAELHAVLTPSRYQHHFISALDCPSGLRALAEVLLVPDVRLGAAGAASVYSLLHSVFWCFNYRLATGLSKSLKKLPFFAGPGQSLKTK